jgi:hypothetical protein
MPEIDAELAETRRRLLNEEQSIEAEIARLRVRVEAIRVTLRGLDGILGIETSRPRGMEAVRLVVTESPVPLSVTQITEEVVRRGWHPNSENPETAVRAGIKRLRAADPTWRLIGGKLVRDPAAETPAS